MRVHLIALTLLTPAVSAGVLVAGGCTRAGEPSLRTYISSTEYTCLPPGPQRVDALYLQARAITGSDAAALALLGSVACADGVRFKHPFDTGLAVSGPMAATDKSTHFFAYAWWKYQDRRRLIPLAKTQGYFWEVLGEIKSWFVEGEGFDRADIGANRLGGEFATMLNNAGDADASILPSAVLIDD